MNRILFIATVVKKHINTFHTPFLKMFKEQGWQTEVSAANDFDDAEECTIPFCDSFKEIPFERFPIHPNNIKAFIQLRRILNKEKYTIIHSHTPSGGLIARLAAIKTRKVNKTKVFYTAHGFHFFKGAPLKNWLLYFPVEWVCSFLTDVLITINQEDYALALKHMHAKKIVYVPGVGVDTEKIKKIFCDRQKKRKELGLGDDDVVILSVGEINDNKNHELIIRALSEIENENIAYVICGKGGRENYLKNLSEKLGVNTVFLGFRNDVLEIYKCCDIFAFPSKREGLSKALMEAMAAQLPVVCSKIRGNTELIESGKGGFLFAADNAKEAAEGILKLVKDRHMREAMGAYNALTMEKYDIKNVEEIMKKIYPIETGEKEMI